MTAPSRPPITWRGLSVLVAVAVLVAVVLLVGGRFSGAPPEAAPSPSGTPASTAARDPETGLRWADLASLPVQVAHTVRLIERGGPFPYAKDGSTFRNSERILPRRPAGYYREYTVATPGEGDRGARRVVTGDDDSQFFYTGDHYASFVRIRR